MATEPVHRFATGAEAVEALTRSVTPMTGTAAYATAERPGSRLPGIAVLPFLTRDAELADFADGLAEEVTAGISKFPLIGKQLVAWQAAKRFATRDTDLRHIGQQLGARYLVEGSIRKS